MNKGTNMTGINKDNNIKKERKTNSSPDRDPNNILIGITTDQRILLEKLANILFKINVAQPDGSSTPLIPDRTLTGFGKSALSFMANIYMTNVLSKSEIAKTFNDKQALNEFVAFRAKYMSFPIDAQIEDLKRVGVVK